MNKNKLIKKLEESQLTELVDMEGTTWNCMSDSDLEAFIILCTDDPLKADDLRVDYETCEGQAALGPASIFAEYDIEYIDGADVEEMDEEILAGLLCRHVFLPEATRVKALRAIGEITREE